MSSQVNDDIIPTVVPWPASRTMNGVKESYQQGFCAEPYYTRCPSVANPMAGAAGAGCGYLVCAPSSRARMAGGRSTQSGPAVEVQPPAELKSLPSLFRSTSISSMRNGLPAVS